MTTVTKHKMDDRHRPSQSGYVNLIPIVWQRAIAIADAASGDDITAFDLPAYYQVVAGSMYVSATLGASCTAQLRAGSTAISAATGGGAAETELLSALPAISASEQAINVLIGGAAVTSAATITICLLCVDTAQAR